MVTKFRNAELYWNIKKWRQLSDTSSVRRPCLTCWNFHSFWRAGVVQVEQNTICPSHWRHCACQSSVAYSKVKAWLCEALKGKWRRDEVGHHGSTKTDKAANNLPAKNNPKRKSFSRTLSSAKARLQTILFDAGTSAFRATTIWHHYYYCCCCCCCCCCWWYCYYYVIIVQTF